MVRTSFVADFVCLMSAPGGWVSTRYLKENGKRDLGLGHLWQNIPVSKPLTQLSN